jgi:16S rRNA (cytosine1402-N4)-methyltransferase
VEQPSGVHKSVLVEEVLHYLNPQPGKVYLDVTFGAGGHTRAILEKEPECSVIAMDWDKTVLDSFGLALQEEFPDRVTLLWGNFALLYKLLKKARIESVDGILADFGTSQIQITERAGFSIYRDTPLDMRMSTAHHKVTAAEIVNKASEEKLREIFWQFGEERYAKYIARAIVEDRKQQRFLTTGQLASLIERVVPKDRSRKIHPATRVFQALRIYVNKELENIELFLGTGLSFLSPKGRFVCISFHSLEDRLVKQFFRDKAQEGKLTVLTPKAIIATDIEIQRNPSARSAKLRAAEKLESI